MLKNRQNWWMSFAKTKKTLMVKIIPLMLIMLLSGCQTISSKNEPPIIPILPNPIDENGKTRIIYKSETDTVEMTYQFFNEIANYMNEAELFIKWHKLQTEGKK